MRAVQGLKIVLLMVLLAGLSAPASVSFNQASESSLQSSKFAAPLPRSLLRASKDDAELLRYLRTAASSPKAQPKIRTERVARALTTAEEAIVQIARFFSSDGKLTYRDSGSGVVVHSNGTILTNVHVIRSTGVQGCTISMADPPRADLIVILIQDPQRPMEPPTPKFAVDLRGLTGEALTRALPAEDSSLDLAVLRINKRIAGAAPPRNVDELIEVVKANALVLEDLSEPPDLEALALWDTAAIEEGQDLQLGGYPVVSPLPRLTFTEGPVLEKRADGTMVLNRAFATYGFSGGALIEKRSGFVVGVLCGGQSLETPVGPLVLAMGRALDARVQQLFSKVPEIKRRPVPRFVFKPEFPKPGETVTLNASGSFDPDGKIAKYEWDFDGDGKPDAQGAQVQRAFQDDGRVTLSVTDSDDLDAQRTQRVILNRREQLQEKQQQCKPIQIGDRAFESIQAAIKAAQPGETITVGPGTCQENLTIDKSVTLQGAGRDKTILLGDGRVPVIKIEVPTGKPQVAVTIESFTIRNGLHAVQVLGNVKVTVRESDLLASIQQGVDAAFGADITLTDNRISENDEEGFVLEGGKAYLRGNTIASNNDKGVVIKNLRTHSRFIPANAALDENKIEMNEGFGVFVTQQAKAHIQGGQISRNKSTGLEADEQADLKVMRTKISENDRGGVRLRDVTAEFKESVLISDNSGMHGIWAEGVTHVGLTSVTISGNEWSLSVRGSASANLTNSTVSSSWYGLWLEDSASATLINSTVSRNDWDGISVFDSANITLTNSIIADNGENGLDMGGSGNAEVKESRFLNNKGCGIVAYAKAQVQGAPNEMRGNGVDLCGNVPAELRRPLVPQTDKEEIRFPEEYQSLQEAVDAVAPAGKVIIAPGNYVVGVTVWKPVMLVGSGRDQTELRVKSWLAFSILADAEGARVEGLKISGGEMGLWIFGKDVTLQDLQVSASKYQGLVVGGSAYVTLKDITVSDTNRGSGISVWDSAQAIFINTTISSNCERPFFPLLCAGLSARDSSTVRLISSTVSSNKINGILVWDSAQVTLTNSTVSGNREGGLLVCPFFLLPTSCTAQVSLTTSTVSDNGEDGLSVMSSARVTLSHSTVSGNKVNGLDVNDSAKVEINNSIIRDNRWCGIYVPSREAQLWGTPNQMGGNGADLCGFTPASLRKPLVPQTGQTWLSVPQDFASLQEAIDAIAPGGTIFVQAGSYTEGLIIWKPLVLQGQQRRETILQPKQGLGISITAEVQGVSLEELTVTGSSGSGIWVYGQATFENIRVYNNSWDGLYVGGLGKVSLANVQISSNFNRGILMRDQSTAKIQNSRISANWRGISVWDSAQLILQDSEVIGNEYGIVFSDYYGGKVEIPYNKILRNEDWGISALGEDCGKGEARAFRGSISGKDNEIELLYNSYGGLCPSYPGSPWPTGFVKKVTTQVPVKPEVLDHAMAKDVMQFDPYGPIDRTNTFSAEDEKAVLWIRFGKLYQAHTITWKWYQPDGKLYTWCRLETADPKDQGYEWWEWYAVWCGIYIKGFKAAEMPGQWRVDVFFDGVPLLSETLTIEAPKGFIASPSRVPKPVDVLRLQALAQESRGHPMIEVGSGGHGKK